jgi:hypothetical protein
MSKRLPRGTTLRASKTSARTETRVGSTETSVT